MSPQYLLFCAYGTDDHQNECKYAALRFFKLASSQTRERTTLVVYTDRPQAYQGFDFGPLHHRIVAVSQPQFVAWKGELDFVYRVKIESLRNFASANEGLVMLIDTDTHLRADIAPLFEAIEQGKCVMHRLEGQILAKGEFREWASFLESQTIPLRGQQFRFPAGLQMWNSGVVGMHTSRVEEFVDEALVICDEVYRRFPRHICEQFAFSYCLQTRYAMHSAEAQVHHYWGLKDFRPLLREFFARRQGSLAELAQASEAVVPERIEADRRRFKRQFPLRRLWCEITGRPWKIEDYFRSF